MFFRFLLVGGSGFLIDAGITYLLILLGLPPWLARVPAIALAMAYTWVANRHFTYEVVSARSIGEAIRYAFVAAAMALANYLIYFVLVSKGIWPLVAVTIATACQTILSFHLYRHIVFSKDS
jgi:putative flippase GtrA